MNPIPDIAESVPPAVPVRHKTGSLGIGVANDVGIIDLPDGAGHVVVAVFVEESTRDVAAQERTIAQIARAAYDYFTFNPVRRRADRPRLPRRSSLDLVDDWDSACPPPSHHEKSAKRKERPDSAALSSSSKAVVSTR